MKALHIRYLLALCLTAIPFTSLAGFKYNAEYYSADNIEAILDDMSDPGFESNYGDFAKIRSELYQQAGMQNQKLSYSEIEALERYQYDAYQPIRRGLARGRMDAETESLVKEIDSAFKNGIKYQGTVFRGERLLSTYRSNVKVGDIVSPSSYLSTSISKTSSYTFHNGQLSRFELNLGQHGIVIPTVRDDELEVLINRNSLFEVTAINTTPKGNQVIYREVSAEQVGMRPIKDLHSGETLTVAEACVY